MMEQEIEDKNQCMIQYQEKIQSLKSYYENRILNLSEMSDQCGNHFNNFNNCSEETRDMMEESDFQR